MSNFLKLQVVWFDNDLFCIEVTASNGDFSAKTSFYANFDGPSILADHISGFPKDCEKNNSKEYEFGQKNLPGYGWVKIQLKCKDSTGRVSVKVSIFLLTYEKDSESADFQFATVPSAIDNFVSELRSMQVRVGDSAVLI